MNAAASGLQSLGDIVQQLREVGEDQDQVSVADIREAFGERSAGPFLVIPAVFEISPIGAIPGLPTVLALIIIVFAAQIVLGRKHLWMPGWLERRSLKGSSLKKAADAMQKPTRWVDRIIRPRLDWLVSRRVLAAVCILLCLTVPALELVPFASTAPMGAIILLGLAMTARDGLVAALGLVLAVGAAVLVGQSLLG
ncbi:exopolysaccharide biosynthesis protein [Achromobacter sp. GG226]|uniref:exopolysaccharide biosynthesis protein n=1 Tax=Verticiella alkaliphila TaxID=2779529 RepID=UPI001C0C7C51|nr:exopolysaccharide biosynthesis protein [Verticiella sp. GG226]MBU4609466.1 exopolysaccharide biosynthesis protein [Verticiella sp. GG226]